MTLWLGICLTWLAVALLVVALIVWMAFEVGAQVWTAHTHQLVRKHSLAFDDESNVTGQLTIYKCG